MRERTTWDRTRIASDLRKVADDPRAMNQDHHSQQPAADKYVIGGPSEFAEDVTKPDTWKVEKDSDGNTKRNEIGMPEMRPESMKQAADDDQDDEGQDKEASVKAKAVLATKAARVMLPKTASEQRIEDQAVTLMALDTSALEETISRLASDDEDEDDEGQAKEAADQDDEGQDKEASDDQDKEADDDEQSKEAADQDDDADGQAKEAKGLPPEFLENIEKKKDEAKDKKDDGDDKEAKKASDDADDDDQSKEAADQDDEGQDKEAADKLAELKQQILACNDMAAMQQLMSQQQQLQQQMQQDDGELVDQLLQEQGQQGQQVMAEAGIQMDTPHMDVGDVQLTEADSVLSQVFASSQEVQNAMTAAGLQDQQVTASQGTTRTASTRTVGTRPTSGVSTLGGAGAPASEGSSAAELSNLWSSAPDVSGTFR